MDREINFASILAVEKQIEEHEGYKKIAIQLKRAQNSLLNVSTLLPPEILGQIFCWNAIVPYEDFVGLSRGSYNFLLVCHHWFEVASRTPDLWSFWGNSIRDWAHRHTRCGTAPLDLVLARCTGYGLDDRLRDALWDRAARDLVRRVHLRGTEAGLLNCIISSIVIEGEDARSSSTESFIVESTDKSPVDVSAFFSRYHLPRLRCLRLSGCTTPSWSLLELQTTALTTLWLETGALLPTPTPSQLLSIISSSPLLRNLVLSHTAAVHVVGGDVSTVRAQLRHLEFLNLSGNFSRVFWFLDRLELPDKMDDISLSLYRCSSLDLERTLGPYLGGRIRRRGGFPGGRVGLRMYYDDCDTFCFALGNIHNGDGPTKLDLFAVVPAVLSVDLEKEEAEGLLFDIIAHIPWEQVIYLNTGLPILRSEELCVEMCNLTHLDLDRVDLSTWFLVPDLCGRHTFKDILRNLDHIRIREPTLSKGWSPLTDFLSRRAAIGNRISWLYISGYPRMDEGVVEIIEGAVEVFEDGGTGRHYGNC